MFFVTMLFSASMGFTFNPFTDANKDEDNSLSYLD